MTKQIDVTTLRDWLDQGKPVTVVDPANRTNVAESSGFRRPMVASLLD